MIEKNKRIELRVTEEEKIMLQQLAAEKGLRLSQYILQKSLYEDLYEKKKKGN